MFPIAGTAIMAIGLWLMSFLGSDSPIWFALIAMAVLGLGLGLVMQVLVLAVQNAVEYRNLGVATSGATLFRSMGGALGVSGAGAIFSAGLAKRLAATLPADTPVAATPTAIEALPDNLRTLYHAAYAGALHPVFLTAAGLAVLAFALTWAMQEIPLRETVGTAPATPDIGDSFAMPRNATSLDELRRIVGHAASETNRTEALRRVLSSLDMNLSPEEAWLLLRVARSDGTVAPHALDGAEAHRVAPVAERLIGRGLLRDDGTGQVCTTPEGSAMFETLVERFRARLSEIVSRWHPDEHVEVRQMLTDFARDLLRAMPHPSS
jgi:hypothetical protein